jgi:hypothetical protein
MMSDLKANLRRLRPAFRTVLLCSAVATPFLAGIAAADDTDAVTKEDLKLLQQQLETQKQQLELQKQALQQQQNQLNFLKSQVGGSDDPDTTPVTFNLGTGTFTTGGVTNAQDSTEEPVGEAPSEEAPSQEEEAKAINRALEGQGVLTPAGTLVVEPSLQFTHSTSNRFFAQGVEIQDIVFIGLIEVSEADRDTVEAALNFRYGITDRFEIETRIPYVFRSEDVQQSFITQFNQPTLDESNSGDNIGDVEVAAHYQITSAPIYTIGNVRVKAPTGTSPFDVDFDTLGRPTELATGSGFWGVQPSITAIFPTDPVVFFGTFGYTINIGESVDETRLITPPQLGALPISATIGDVDPGDSINLSLGMGLSLNEKFSFNLGFKYDYIFPTTQETTVVDPNPQGPNPPPPPFTGETETDPLHAASFLVGWSYQISDAVGMNLNFEVGATDDANDFSVRLGVPIRFNLFGNEDE